MHGYVTGEVLHLWYMLNEPDRAGMHITTDMNCRRKLRSIRLPSCVRQRRTMALRPGQLQQSARQCTYCHLPSFVSGQFRPRCFALGRGQLASRCSLRLPLAGFNALSHAGKGFNIGDPQSLQSRTP